MPGWRKSLTIEVRDVSRPGIFLRYRILLGNVPIT